MYCNKCGKKIEEGSRFCNFCGSSMTSQNKTGAESEKKDRKTDLKINLIIAVLAFLTGSAVTFGFLKSMNIANVSNQETAYMIEGEKEGRIKDRTEENEEQIADESTKEIILETEPVAGWKQTEYGWWYDNGDGSYTVDGWQNIDGKWYCFNESGYMRTGWITSDGRDYYLNSDGSMAVNTWIDGIYYVGEDGALEKTVDYTGYYACGEEHNEYNSRDPYYDGVFRITQVDSDRIYGEFREGGDYSDGYVNFLNGIPVSDGIFTVVGDEEVQDLMSSEWNSEEFRMTCKLDTENDRTEIRILKVEGASINFVPVYYKISKELGALSEIR